MKDMNDGETHCDEARIGDPCLKRSGLFGYVYKIEKAATTSYTLGGVGGMERNEFNIFVVWDDETTCNVPLSIARPWLQDAERANLDGAGQDLSAMVRRAEEKRAAALKADQERRAADKAAADAFKADAMTKIPDSAVAVIVGELVQDQSDSMTDYFGSTTTKTILLAWSKHTRDLFPEMRKAALNHPSTAPLADASEECEHREKYSMGAGYYLKLGGRHSNGWKVSKRVLTWSGKTLEDKAAALPIGEWAIPEPGQATPAPIGEGNGYKIERRWHSKRNAEIWVAVPLQRMDRGAFDAEVIRAKDEGGWYCRKFKGEEGGFAFSDRSTAHSFAGIFLDDEDDSAAVSAYVSEGLGEY